jgi:hypothetical protein
MTNISLPAGRTRPLGFMLQNVTGSSPDDSLQSAFTAGLAYGVPARIAFDAIKLKRRYPFYAVPYEAVSDLGFKKYGWLVDVEDKRADSVKNLKNTIAERASKLRAESKKLASSWTKLESISEIRASFDRRETVLNELKELSEHKNLIKRYEYGQRNLWDKIRTYKSPAFYKTIGAAFTLLGTGWTIREGYRAYQTDGGFGRNWYKFIGRTAGGAIGATAGAPFGFGISILGGISGAYSGENYLASYYDKHYSVKT